MNKLIPSLLVAATGLGQLPARPAPASPLGSAAMVLEWEPEAGAVLLLSAESDEPLQRLCVLHPDGRRLFDLDARGAGRGRLTCMQIELEQAPLAALRESFPAGPYDLRATTARGAQSVGQAWLSFELPTPPRILQPAPGALVSTAGLTLAWLGDPTAVAYELHVEQEEDGGLRVKLPPLQSSYRVPNDFLRPGVETTFEVIAVGASGNRSKTEVCFATLP